MATSTEPMDRKPATVYTIITECGGFKFVPNEPAAQKEKPNIQPYAQQETYMYDLIVIGGGSAGIACAKEAATAGAKVALLDYVKPSPIGSKWGIGGTCVNVGCIPKKLMHTSSIYGSITNHDSVNFGWNKSCAAVHDWKSMVGSIQDHIKGLNFSYKGQLNAAGVTYINAYGTFESPHTVKCINNDTSEKSVISGRYIVIATGCRPRFPNLKGAMQYCISSDDIFSLQESPKTTLIIGGSYVALECASFLRGFGCDVTVMVRTDVILRGFDRQMARLLVDALQKEGIKFLFNAVPSRVDKLTSDKGKLRVTWRSSVLRSGDEVFLCDTVLCATGRAPMDIGATKVGVKVNKEGKIMAKNEQTDVPHIFAIGDVLADVPELTPTAIKAGILLARRLFINSKDLMDYRTVPTTVFTYPEYGSCGLSEETARATLGPQNVEVYHSTFKPLEWTIDMDKGNCYCKIIVNKADNERVVGFHILSPNAGEITQGFSVAMKCGATKKVFDDSLGIHPTIAEEFTTLSVTKSSGKSEKKPGC